MKWFALRAFLLPVALFVLSTACVRTAAAAVPSPLVLQGLGRATLPIDGAWQFHLGDDPAWASPQFDDSGWESIQVGRPWEGQGHPGAIGFGWYRRHLVIQSGSPADWQLALLLWGVQDACEVYWNGKLVGSFGKVPPKPVWYLEPPRHEFQLGAPQSGVLAIRVWKSPHPYLTFPDEGGLAAVPLAGSSQAIAAEVTAAHYRWLRESSFTLGLTLLSTAVAVLALLAWLRNRKRAMLFWLAIAMFHSLAILPTLVPGLISFRLFYGTIAQIVEINDVALWFLLLYLLGLYDNPKLLRWTRIMSIAIIASGLIDTALELFEVSMRHPRVFLSLDIGSTIPGAAMELYGLVLIGFALRKRLDAARWLLAVAVLFNELVQAFLDLTGLGERWTHWTFADLWFHPIVSIFGCPLGVGDIIDALLLAAILYAAWSYSEEQSSRQNALEQEYRSAQELQQILIPEALPTLPGYAVTSAYRPAQEVGGDFFQLMALPNDAALLVIGDVSGKGLHAAMAVALIVGAIRSTVETTSDPAAVLAALNRRLYGRLRGGFATCLVLRLDALGNCLIANAGHLPPYLNGEEVSLTPALPLGLTANEEYGATVMRMASGDRLTLYTDGLLEARNGTGELFGFTRIAELLSTRPNAPEIAKAAQAFGQEDDITVLTLSFGAAGVSG